MTTKTNDYYGPRMTARREQFNKLINGCNLVLCNNIPEVDQSIWDNWQDKSPMSVCEIYGKECEYHGEKLEDGECPYQDEMPEVYQWYITSDSDAEFLKRHGQYVTYSDVLDCYVLAITHFGTAWDYVDSMVDAFNDCYYGEAK